MAVDIKGFTAAMGRVGGGAKSSFFTVEIALPELISGQDKQILTYLCDAAQLPGMQFGVDDQTRPFGYGPVRPTAWGVMHSPVQLSFIGDNSGVVLRTLNQWCDRMVVHDLKYNPASAQREDGRYPYLVAYPQDYLADVVITTYDPKFQKIATFCLHQAMPMGMAGVNMSMSDTGYQRIPLTLAYTAWSATYRDTLAGSSTGSGPFASAASSRLLGGIGSKINSSVSGALGGGLIGQAVGRAVERKFERARSQVENRLDSAVNDVLNKIQQQVPPELQDIYAEAIPLLGGITDFKG